MSQRLSWQGDCYPSWCMSSVRSWHLAVGSGTVPCWSPLERPLCAPHSVSLPGWQPFSWQTQQFLQMYGPTGPRLLRPGGWSGGAGDESLLTHSCSPGFQASATWPILIAMMFPGVGDATQSAPPLWPVREQQHGNISFSSPGNITGALMDFKPGEQLRLGEASGPVDMGALEIHVR